MNEKVFPGCKWIIVTDVIRNKQNEMSKFREDILPKNRWWQASIVRVKFLLFLEHRNIGFVVIAPNILQCLEILRGVANHALEIMRVAGKLCFHILFYLIALLSRTALLTKTLCFCLFCYVRISLRDCFTDGSMLNNISLKLVVIFFCSTFNLTLSFYTI